MASRSTLQKLSLIFLASSLVPSATALSIAITAAQALGVLEQRDTTCANKSDISCSSTDSRLPGNFCCSSGTSCISLDSSSSILCCPTGSDCQSIQPIQCDITLQDATTHPGVAVQTTKLNESLPVCGSSCCPFGYICDASRTICNLDVGTSSLSSSFESPNSSSSTGSATSTSSSAATTQTPSQVVANNTTGIDSTNHLPSGQCNRFPGIAVVAGFFPGVLAGALLALIGVICFGHSPYSSQSSSKSPVAKFASFRRRSRDGPIIEVSDPIPCSQSARTDFLRREPPTLARTGTRVKSWFSTRSSPTYTERRSPSKENHWKMPTPPVPNNVPLGPLGKIVPVTPERQIGPTPGKVLLKEPSMESIKIYSPPNFMKGPSIKQTQVRPLREMAKQRKADEATPQKLSPFRTPEKIEFPLDDSPKPDDSKPEFLNPSRFGDPSGSSKKGAGDQSRPVTTFTDMLHGIGFPDPASTPEMPAIPRGLNTNRGRR